MRWTGLCVAAVVTIGFVSAPPARAQADKEALKALPDNTIAFVAVNRLNELDDKLAKLGKQFKAPLPVKPLALIRTFAGIEKGLDDKGTILAAALDTGGGIDRPPAGVVFVPVTDYKEFITQLSAKDADAEITEIEVPLVGVKLLVGKRGKFAVAAQLEHEEALKAVLASKTAMPVSTALQAYVAQNDAVGVVTTRGVRMGTEAARKGIDQVRPFLDNLPADAAFVGTMVDAISGFFKSCETDVANLGMGVRIDAGGNVHLDGRVMFVKGSGFAKAGREASKPAAEGPLAGLPSGPFALAIGGTISDKLMARMMQFNLEILKTVAKDLPAEKMRKLEEAYAGMAKGVRGMGMVLQVGKGDEPLVGTLAGVFHTENAAAYMTSYEKSLKDMTEVMKDLPIPFMPTQDLKRIKVAGKPGLEITMDFSGFPGIDDEAKRMLDKMFGEGGKLTASMAPLNDKMVIVRYSGAKGLQETMQSLKANAAGLSNDPQVTKTAAMLPEGSQWAIYISPKGGIELANRAIKMFGAPQELPAFPATPPIGVGIKLSEADLQIHAAVPAAFLQALAQYIPQVKNLRLQ